MHLTDEIGYSADPVTVFEMLRDPAFVTATCVRTGAGEHTVEVDDAGGDGAVTIRSRREMPSDRLPEPAKSLLGGRLVIVQEERWDVALPVAADGGVTRRGTVRVEVAGTPLTFVGTMVLEGGATTRHRYDGELKAKVPLVGGKLEKSAEPAIRRGLQAQEKAAVDWLTSTS